ncbi:MAG: hypothetical protein IKA48_15325 [Fibrobacter sp.]|nr:hypothetical protein [Fibrobacter sp.]
MNTKRNIVLLGLLAFALTLSGCYFSRTTIRTTDGKDYKIYGDDELICESSQDCKIGQRGAPHTMELKAVKGNTVVGRTTIKREITTASVMWGVVSYFTTLFVYQAYPDNVYIPIDYSSEMVSRTVRETGGNDWNTSPYKSQGSAWDRPGYEPNAEEYNAPAEEY